MRGGGHFRQGIRRLCLCAQVVLRERGEWSELTLFPDLDPRTAKRLRQVAGFDHPERPTFAQFLALQQFIRVAGLKAVLRTPFCWSGAFLVALLFDMPQPRQLRIAVEESREKVRIPLIRKLDFVERPTTICLSIRLSKQPRLSHQWTAIGHGSACTGPQVFRILPHSGLEGLSASHLPIDRRVFAAVRRADMFDPRRIVFAVLMAAVVGGLVSPLFAREEIVPQANAPAWPPEPIVLNGTTAVGVSDDQQTVVIAVDQLGNGRAQTTFSLGLAPGSRAPEAGVGNARVIATPSRVTLQRESSIHIFSVVGKDTGPAPTQPVIQLLALIKGGVKDMTLEQAITHYLKTENRPVKRAGEPDFFASCASRSRQVQLLGLVAAAMNPFPVLGSTTQNISLALSCSWPLIPTMRRPLESFAMLTSFRTDSVAGSGVSRIAGPMSLRPALI
jgi:hypothetical protein